VILLPRIDALERAQDHLELRFVVTADNPYFVGHFRDCGLLPGVVQVGWAIELARVHIPYSGRFRALSAVKFMRVIQPDSAVTLRLAADAERRELSFGYRLGDEPCSSGCVLFH
jgi:3-hydroxymyristoyl/3-hydroxydecanoyl-(acyl carrier protein) dehydratase